MNDQTFLLPQEGVEKRLACSLRAVKCGDELKAIGKEIRNEISNFTGGPEAGKRLLELFVGVCNTQCCYHPPEDWMYLTLDALRQVTSS
jgi:hypothetical protein